MYNNKLAVRDSAPASTEGSATLHTDLGQTGTLIWGRLTVELRRRKWEPRTFLFYFWKEGKTEEGDTVVSTQMSG